MTRQIFSVKLLPDVRDALDKMAKESGRSSGQVVERLVVLATNDAKTLAALGIVNAQPTSEARP
jgi:hypothetical protein